MEKQLFIRDKFLDGHTVHRPAAVPTIGQRLRSDKGAVFNVRESGPGFGQVAIRWDSGKITQHFFATE